MTRDAGARLADRVREASEALTPSSLRALAADVAGARVVMIGEASHGTSEFYTSRAALTRALIEEHDFAFVGVEGDWPPCASLDAFVRHVPGASDSARDALAAFRRWPAWMWANWEVAAFAAWLRAHNGQRPEGSRVAFHGLDVYSLHESLAAVMRYLRTHQPDAVGAAERAAACFEPYGHGDGFPTGRIVPPSCEDDVIEILVALDERGPVAEDGRAWFDARQNARIALEAERYYRAALRGGGASWNVRDRHMDDTLDRLLDAHGDDSRAVVWAHNTHVGDARYTDMANAGMVNIGQLARARYGRDNVALVGLGSHRGTVLAGRSWGAEQTVMEMPEAREGSWEDVYHRAGTARAVTRSRSLRNVEAADQKRGHRAIGVVYRPEAERTGNYVPTVLPDRYDAFLYLDRTDALHPLQGAGARADPPDTYPWGF